MSRNPIISWYEEWSNKTPYVTRVLMIILATSYLISWIFETDKVFNNSISSTITKYEVYRLIFSPLCSNSILSIILAVLFFPRIGTKMETSLGSASFFFLIGTLTLLVNSIFIAVCLLLYLIGNMPEANFFSCAGFWLILFALITMECFQNPNQPMRMFLVPVDIPSKYFPLIMYAVFCLFRGPILDYAISIGVGFMSQNGYFDCLKPSSSYLESLESPTGILHSISRSRGWVLAGAAIGHNAWIINSGTEGAETGVHQIQGGTRSENTRSGRGGFGNWAAQENVAVVDIKEDNANAIPFGGQGRTLGGATASTSSRIGWLGGEKAPLSSSVESLTTKEREAVTARRLAAFSPHIQEEHISGTEILAEGNIGKYSEDNIEKNLEKLQISENKRAIIAKAVDKRMNSIRPIINPNESTSLLSAAASKLSNL